MYAAKVPPDSTLSKCLQHPQQIERGTVHQGQGAVDDGGFAHQGGAQGHDLGAAGGGNR